MTKIKICGLFRQEDIEAANIIRPNYIGFVFAKSPRQISPKTAEGLKKNLLPKIEAAGVFVNEKPAQVAALLNAGIIQLAQLHGQEDDAYIKTLRGLTSAPIIRAVPVCFSLPALPSVANYLLFDTAAKKTGGTGKSFNWCLLKNYKDKPYFLAGGLNCGNVQAAIKTLHPFGVDVSSGVESEGLKDPKKMAEFVRLVRSANVQKKEQNK